MIPKTNTISRSTSRPAVSERPIRSLDNLFLNNKEIKDISSNAVRAEFVAVPFLAFLPLLNSLFNHQTSSVQASNNVYPPVINPIPQPAKKSLSIASLSNAVLDLLSFLGELYVRPICSIGNLIRMVVNGFMAFGDEQSKRFANIFYNFASGFIAIGWGINKQHDIEKELYKHENFFEKANFQFKSFFTFWKELPKNLKEGNLWNKKNEHLALKSRLPMFGYFAHALLAFVSTGILLVSNLLPKEDLVQHPLSKDNNEIRNNTESFGWQLGQISRLPLIVSIFADVFKPGNLKEYRLTGALLSLSYGVSTIINMLWMHDHDKTAKSDFVKNLFSNLRSLWIRFKNNNRV
ncbi:MAG: hypothetical protein SFU25_09485 [Candidatus Caenarcaniphilales bacterium]|nr:hypothetical protein [Candidatus Caenarcaniphilales bacterium]